MQNVGVCMLLYALAVIRNRPFWHIAANADWPARRRGRPNDCVINIETAAYRFFQRHSNNVGYRFRNRRGYHRILPRRWLGFAGHESVRLSLGLVARAALVATARRSQSQFVDLVVASTQLLAQSQAFDSVGSIIGQQLLDHLQDAITVRGRSVLECIDGAVPDRVVIAAVRFTD